MTITLSCLILSILIKWSPPSLQVGFKLFLGIVPTVANWNQKGDEFSLILDQNPLTDFVELPSEHPNLLYSNMFCGVIRGALEMVSTKAHTPTHTHTRVHNTHL